MSGWIGVDLDGTLAKYPNPDGIDGIGEPIPLMVDRVKEWLAKGIDVRIFTARVACTETFVMEPGICRDEEFAASQRALIFAWCLHHIGQELPITATRDYAMIELWDDRAITVMANTGEILATWAGREGLF